MKSYCSFVLLFIALAHTSSTNKNKKTLQQKPNLANNAKKSGPGIGLKVKPAANRVPKIVQKPKSPIQNKNTLPKIAGKRPIKYIAKIVNNTKRWMPAFSDFSNDMESSMMYDSGFVAGGEQGDALAGNSQQQQPSGMLRPPAQEPMPSTQNTPPEQSFLTPGAEDSGMSGVPGVPPVGRALGNQYQQGYVNDIEAFTKDVSNGAPPTGENQDLSALENYPDSAFMNPKFQEGDYVGPSLQENKPQPNLYDSFTFDSSLSNLAGSPKEPGSSIFKAQESPKIQSIVQALTAKAAKVNAAKPAQTKTTAKEANKPESEASEGDKVADNKESAKDSDQKSNAKEAVKTKKLAKEAKGDDSKTVQDADKAKDTGKEKNDVSETKNDKEAAKEADESVDKGKATDDKASETANAKEQNSESTAAKTEEKPPENAKEETANDKINDSVGNSLKAKAEKEEATESGSNNAKEDSSKEIASHADNGEAKQDDNKDDENKDIMDANKNPSKLAEKIKSHKQSNNGKNQEDVDNQAIINKQINKWIQQKEQEVNNEQARIKKIKQRIRNQKSTRHQASAAARYQITTDSDKPVSDLSIAANVSPAKQTLGFAAGQLRKQLVNNLRHALMKNVAAAMAHRKNVALGGKMGKNSNTDNENSAAMKQDASDGDENASGNAAQQQSGNNNQAQASNMASQSNQQSQNDQQSQGDQQSQSDQQSAQQEGGKMSQNLVTNLMKMDKSMLVETIVKLLNKHKNSGKMQGNSDNSQQMVQDSNGGDKDKDEDTTGNINQSFHGAEESKLDADQQDTASTNTDIQASQDNKPISAASQLEDSKAGPSKPEPGQAEEEDNGGHSEFSAYPVKTQSGAKVYKFKRLPSKGGKARQTGSQLNPDPYAQIGLVDPANNDKVSKHHQESSDSNLKQDLQKQSDLVSKFISTNTKDAADNEDQSKTGSSDPQPAESSQEQLVNVAKPSSDQDLASVAKQSSHKDSSDQQQTASESESTNAIKSSDDTAFNANTPAPSADNQVQDQKSGANPEKDGPSTQSNDDSSSLKPSEMQDDQPQQRQPQEQQQQQSEQQQQPEQQQQQSEQQPQAIQADTEETQADGTKVESHVSADSPQVLAQLNKISDRLHEKMAEQSNNKVAQKLNSGQMKTFLGQLQNTVLPQDDAYASIGSFDPNVKKKAAIMKKKVKKSL